MVPKQVVPDRRGLVEIGKIKENLVTEVAFDCADLGDGSGAYAVVFQRPKGTATYPVAFRAEWPTIVWIVHDADTAKPGTGKVEIRWFGDRKEVGKSKTYMVRINDGLPDPTEAPQEWEGYIGQVAQNAQRAETAADSAAGSAQAAADTLAQVKEDLAAGKLKGEKGDPGKDAPQIDDGAISRENPWSSRKIIDTLCPKLDETGNPVTCYPVAGYPLGVKVSWGPTQAGSGEPSPDNIRPISGREAVKVERCGENLLKIKSLRTSTTNGGCTWTINDDGSITVAGKAEGRASFLGNAVTNLDKSRLQFLPAGSYFIGGKGANVSIYYYGFYADGTPYSQIIANRSVKIEKDVWITVQGSVAKEKNVNETVCPYIVPGTTAPTAYTPYKGDTLDLQLPGTVYGGYVDAVTGQGHETWQVKAFDGTEGWLVYDAGGTNQFFYTTKYTLDENPIKSICSHFSRVSVAGKSVIRIYTTMFTDADALISYLAAQYAAGTPVQIAYKLATPTPITATGAQPIPALAGCNTILTDADSVTITGRADPAHAIAALQAQLATATQQLAETQAAVVDTTAMTVDYIYEQDSKIFGGENDDDQTDAMPT